MANRLKILSMIIMAGANLIPANSFAQSPKRPPPVPSVIVEEARKEKIFDTIEALGNLRANETVNLNALVTEKVTAIKFEDGQRVKAGDILVEMTSAEESALLNEEQSRVDEALRQVNRIKPLIEQGAASTATLDAQQREYKTAKSRLEAIRSKMADRIITAPFDGILGLRNISVGTLLQPGMIITTLDDDSVMKLDFDVPSVFLSSIKEALPIKVSTKAFAGKYFEGLVSSVDSQINPVTRSFKVRALIPNPDLTLKPGLLMIVELLKNERMAVMVSEESVLMEGDKTFVFVAEPEGEKMVASKRKVTIGLRQPGRIEIMQGLAEGEKVIAHGIMRLNDGAEIAIRANRKPGEDLKDILKPAPEKAGNGSENLKAD